MANRFQLNLEFPLHCSPAFLFGYLTTPVLLEEWFADKVIQKGNHYDFEWDGDLVTADLIENRFNSSVKFKPEGYESGEYIEMKIVVDEITDEVELAITDFSDEDEADEIRLSWENSIARLKSVIGA